MRTVSLKPSLSSLSSVVGLVVVGGCADMPEPQGQIAVCYAVEGADGETLSNDGNGGFGLAAQTHVGLHPADPDTSRPAPASFSSCIATIVAPVHVELIDADGSHVWLGVDVVARGQQLITEDVFADITDGELTIGGNRNWSISDVLTLTSADGLRLALQNGLPLDDSLGGIFFIADDGGDGLPTWTSCQSITAHALRFRSVIESPGFALKNGESREVPEEGFVVANVGSFEYGEANCTDIPSGVTHVSWAVIAAR